MKAIETTYKGYRFRSRLEARWAVFFDAMGARWEYEPQGYALKSGWYLPDFFLPDIQGGLWVEIKGQRPTDLERKKLIELSAHTAHPATFRVGDPMRDVTQLINECAPNASNSDDCWVYFGADDCADGPYFFCICPWCEKLGFEFDGRGARVCDYTSHHNTEAAAQRALASTGFSPFQRVDDKVYSGTSAQIMHAAHKARAARFEHGEKGAA